jgi:hypothetical protein
MEPSRTGSFVATATSVSSANPLCSMARQPPLSGDFRRLLPAMPFCNISVKTNLSQNVAIANDPHSR